MQVHRAPVVRASCPQETTWGIYLYNGRIRPVAHDLSRESPHLLAIHGHVIHCSVERAPLGWDFRDADFAKVQQANRSYLQFVDLQGATVLPGLCDAHVHFLWWSDTLDEVDLTGCHNLDETLETIRHRASIARPVSAHPAWLRGHGWSHNGWPGGQLPTAGQLDTVTGTIPTILTSKCGHLAWLNSAALRLTGIAAAPCPEGGEIHRDSRGNPTGILAETAIQLATDQIPPRSKDQEHQAFLRGQAIAHSFGLTSMHTPEAIHHFARLQNYRSSGELTTRINFLMPVEHLGAMKELALTRGLGDDLLRISGTKLFADGSLGGRTAAMVAPYEGEPKNRGIVVSTEAEILQATRTSQALGIPMATHAIGDQAVRSVLLAYRQCQLELAAVGLPPLAHRIEHLQCINPDDLPLLREVRPVASVQPVHLCADIDAILRHWGQKRGELAYAFRTAKKLGCPLIFGSDAPVEPISPWLGIFAAVTREDLCGHHKDGFVRSESLTLPDALEAYTAGPSRAVGTWPGVGSLLPGSLADFAIYPTDPCTESPILWKTLRVWATYLAGQRVWFDPGGPFA
jgi:predicted amidohydrolase YtcJ